MKHYNWQKIIITLILISCVNADDICSTQDVNTQLNFTGCYLNSEDEACVSITNGGHNFTVVRYPRGKVDTTI